MKRLEAKTAANAFYPYTTTVRRAHLYPKVLFFNYTASILGRWPFRIVPFFNDGVRRHEDGELTLPDSSRAFATSLVAIMLR
jgi:hypothetical protein